MRAIDADAFKAYMRDALEQTRDVYPDKGEWAETITEQFCIDIDEQPTIEPEPKWIPCSETEDLPEHEVLCCDKYGEELIGWLSCEDDQWICESDGEMMYDPIAWREKPEPYKERREE